ncbi:hypothetical protein HY024_01275 [Candidatus Curtissbacteria bacterium]|nr:hypothetical protein [Candidatus Curtissbacteria bacterium]
MNDFVSTPCIRCGKDRIFKKSWKEKLDNKGTMMTIVEAICPDKDCQKIVDAMFAEKREKRIAAENRNKSIKLKPTPEAPIKLN